MPIVSTPPPPPPPQPPVQSGPLLPEGGGGGGGGGIKVLVKVQVTISPSARSMALTGLPSEQPEDEL